MGNSSGFQNADMQPVHCDKPFDLDYTDDLVCSFKRAEHALGGLGRAAVQFGAFSLQSVERFQSSSECSGMRPKALIASANSVAA